MTKRFRKLLARLSIGALLALLLLWLLKRNGKESKPPPPANRVIIPVAPSEPDDLKRIEGIGPKISSVLQERGVLTFAQLAALQVEALRKILDEEGIRIADPSTWPEQAELAAAARWEDLESLQDKLQGGRRV